MTNWLIVAYLMFLIAVGAIFYLLRLYLGQRQTLQHLVAENHLLKETIEKLKADAARSASHDAKNPGYPLRVVPLFKDGPPDGSGRIQEALEMISCEPNRKRVLYAMVMPCHLPGGKPGVKILVKNEDEINHLHVNPSILSEVLKLALHIFANQDTGIIFLEITEDEDRYYLEFNNSFATVLNVKDSFDKHTLVDNPDGWTRLTAAMDSITKISVKSEYLMNGNLLGKFKINLWKSKNTFIPSKEKSDGRNK